MAQILKLCVIVIFLSVYQFASGQTTPFGGTPPAVETKSEGIAPKYLPIAKKYYQSLYLKNTPAVLSLADYKQLEIKTPLCDDIVMQTAFLECQPRRCFKQADVFGMPILYEYVIGGVNKFGNCDIAFMDTRYFVPKEDLSKVFSFAYKNFALMPDEMEGNVGIGGAEAKMNFTYKIDGFDCKVTVTSKGGPLAPALSNLRPLNKGEKPVGSIGVDGVSYAPIEPEVDVQIVYTSKIISVVLAADAPKSCTGVATVLFDLEKKGLSLKLMQLKPKVLLTQ